MTPDSHVDAIPQDKLQLVIPDVFGGDPTASVLVGFAFRQGQIPKLDVALFDVDDERPSNHVAAEDLPYEIGYIILAELDDLILSWYEWLLDYGEARSLNKKAQCPQLGRRITTSASAAARFAVRCMPWLGAITPSRLISKSRNSSHLLFKGAPVDSCICIPVGTFCESWVGVEIN